MDWSTSCALHGSRSVSLPAGACRRRGKDSLSAPCAARKAAYSRCSWNDAHAGKGLHKRVLIAEQLRAITGLTNERDDLAQQAAQLALLRQRLGRCRKTPDAAHGGLAQYRQSAAAASAAQRSIVTLEEGLQQLRNRYGESQQESQRLRRTVAEQRQSLDEARQENLEYERRYLVLADDFDSLKVKYDKLVRPA